MRIKPKEPIPVTFDTSQNVDNKLELMKHASLVHSRGMKTDITSDFLFAKLDEQSEDAITELTEQAFFSRRSVNRIKAIAIEYTWVEEKQQWLVGQLSEWKIQAIEMLGQSMFDAFMTAPQIKCILKRNKPKNPLLKLLAGYDDDEVSIQDQRSEEVLDYIEKKRQEGKER